MSENNRFEGVIYVWPPVPFRHDDLPVAGEDSDSRKANGPLGQICVHVVEDHIVAIGPERAMQNGYQMLDQLNRLKLLVDGEHPTYLGHIVGQPEEPGQPPFRYAASADGVFVEERPQVTDVRWTRTNG